MDSTEFDKNLTDLRLLIADGIGYLSSWYAITNLDEESAKALSRYRGFFKLAQLSFRYSSLLQFSKIFDHHPRALSIRNLLKAAEENRQALIPYASDEDLERIKSLIEENKEVLTSLKNFRDQRLAHYDSELSKNTSLTYGQVKKLVSDLKEMFDILTLGHDHSQTSFDHYENQAEHHTNEVIKLMREDRDKSKQKISELTDERMKDDFPFP